jgi:hypothetical protein
MVKISQTRKTTNARARKMEMMGSQGMWVEDWGY